MNICKPISFLVDRHRFFVGESVFFVGKWKEGEHKFKWNKEGRTDGSWVIPWDARLYYPIAWCKFMYYSIKEMFKQRGEL